METETANVTGFWCEEKSSTIGEPQLNGYIGWPRNVGESCLDRNGESQTKDKPGGESNKGLILKWKILQCLEKASQWKKITNLVWSSCEKFCGSWMVALATLTATRSLGDRDGYRGAYREKISPGFWQFFPKCALGE